MAEKGLLDLTIMAQVGHVAPQMLKHYSHIRRQALNLAAAALEPSFVKPQTTTLERSTKPFGTKNGTND